MGFGSFLFGQPEQVQQTQRFGPQRQQAFSQILQQALSGLQNPSAGFQPIADKAMNQFQTQTVPSLAERFTSMGQGGQRSSDFSSAIGGAGADLGRDLSAQESQYGLQRGGQLQQLLGMGLTPQFESSFRPQTHGFLGNMATQGGGELLKALIGLI